MKFLESTPDVLTIPEAAALLKMSSSIMQAIVDNGQIPQIIIGGQPLIFKPFLVSYIESLYKFQYTDTTVNAFGMMNLDNSIPSDFAPCPEGVTDMATKYKINQYVLVNGQKRWVSANTMQEFVDKVIKLTDTQKGSAKHDFAEYAWNWYNTYSKPNVETATAITYKRQLTLYLIPAFQGLSIEDISTDDAQRLFNSMSGAKSTKDKARMVLNQIMDAAIEDKLIAQNPVKSRKVKITGKASKATVPYSVEQMRYLIQHIEEIKNPADRTYMALQALHPLRLEEVLGLQPEDVDRENMVIHVRRAVTHPTRNQPEIKDTKTDSSCRTIGLSSLALPHLLNNTDDCFILGGDSPLSYTQVRRMCERIKKDIGFTENITPIRFRTTVLTDLYDQTKDIKLAQAAAGHTTSAMTLKYYVKGRETSSQATAAVEKAYTA